MMYHDALYVYGYWAKHDIMVFVAYTY